MRIPFAETTTRRTHIVEGRGWQRRLLSGKLPASHFWYANPQSKAQHCTVRSKTSCSMVSGTYVYAGPGGGR